MDAEARVQGSAYARDESYGTRPTRHARPSVQGASSGSSRCSWHCTLPVLRQARHDVRQQDRDAARFQPERSDACACAATWTLLRRTACVGLVLPLAGYSRRCSCGRRRRLGTNERVAEEIHERRSCEVWRPYVGLLLGDAEHHSPQLRGIRDVCHRQCDCPGTSV